MIFRCIWTWNFTRFTRLQIYTWQVATEALVPSVYVCGHNRGGKKDFLRFFLSIFSLSSSTGVWRPIRLGWHVQLVCACVCRFCVLKWPVGSRGSEAGGVVLVPGRAPGHTHTQPHGKARELRPQATRGPNFATTRWVKSQPKILCKNLDPALAYRRDWGGFCWSGGP